MNNKVEINYLKKDFNTVREELINYLKTFFPEQWQDFNISSPGMAILELNAYVCDILSYTIDKKYIELFLDGAQSRASIYRLAKTKGYKPPGVRPAISIVDIIIEVPSTADGPDTTYLPLYKQGMKVKGIGQIFETIEDTNFASDFSEDGFPNRTIQPIYNGNQEVIKYRIVKREKIQAGQTIIKKIEVQEEGGVPFFQIDLPEKNVLDIVGIMIMPMLNVVRTPTYTMFNDDTYKYHEVDYLPTSQIFVEDDDYTESDGVKVGYWKDVPKRFQKEFLSDGSCRITFGGGDENYDAYNNYISRLTSEPVCEDNTIDISDILDNTALGNKVPKNCTIFLKYRVGGGVLSNVGANTLQEVADIVPVILGQNADTNAQVIGSTRANNPIPAIGGKGLPSVDEIRYNLAANHAAQERCVVLNDYISRAYQINGKFGAPFRIHAVVDDNKVKFFILSISGDGKLVSTSTTRIKDNLVNYLSKYRMINDYVEINDGQVINIQLEVDLFVDQNNFNKREIKSNAAKIIKDFFDVNNWQMNQNIYVSQVVDAIREVPGVINVVDIRFFNLEGGGYSNSTTSQATGDRNQILETGGFITQIEFIDNAIFSTPTSMFEIKYPEINIKIRVG